MEQITKDDIISSIAILVANGEKIIHGVYSVYKIGDIWCSEDYTTVLNSHVLSLSDAREVHQFIQSVYESENYKEAKKYIESIK